MDKELRNATKNFKKVKPNTVFDFSKFYEHRKYPRFFMSVLYLASKPDYYYGMVNDCLCILKKKMIGMPIVYLIIPPINGDISKEKETIDYFNKLKIKTRLSEEDKYIYGYNNIKENKLGEFIYDLELTTKLEGSDFTSFRRFIRKLSDNVDVSYIKQFDFFGIKQAIALNSKWEKWKKENKDRASCHTVDKTVPIFMDTKNSILVALLDKSNNMVCYDLSENVGNNNIVITTRYFDYYNPLVNNSVYYLHHNTCKYWYEEGFRGLANFGSSVGVKDLDASKQRLKPVKILKMYDFDYNYKFTKDEWNAIC